MSIKSPATSEHGNQLGLRAHLLWWTLRLLGFFPLSSMQQLGRCVGRALAIFPLRECQVAQRNVQLCFPELPALTQRQLARAGVKQTVQSLFELPWIWTRPSADLLKKIDAVHGLEQLTQALASGRGILVAAPHFGAWELLNRWLAKQTPMSVLYRAPKSAWLEPLLIHCRARPQITLLRAEPAAVRTLLKRLQAGQVIAILPDQQPKAGEGEFADFFNIPAMTMTLLPKLAQRTGATVLFCSAQRTASGRFIIRIELAEPEVIDASTLNANIEHIARRDPSQYQLTYKRFSMRPEGVGRRYG